MKILHVITRIDRGGSAEVVLQIAARQRACGHEVTLAMGESEHPQVDPEEYSRETGVQIVYIKTLQRETSPLPDLRALASLFVFIRRTKPEVVHTHTSKAGFIGRLAAWLARSPVIVHTPHGHIFHSYYSNVRTRFFILLERLAARCADRITTLTDLGARDHVEFRIASPEKFATIPPGIDLTRFHSGSSRRAAARSALGLRPGELLVGWVGRLVDIKDCATFLRACSHVLPSCPRARFVVAGDGELRAALDAQVAQLKLPVQFLGNRPDVPDLMAAMDVFVLSSTNEGFGRVLVEAMATGLPVVATAVGGVPEVVQDGQTGLLVPPSDPRAMADAITTLLDDPGLRAAFGREGQAHVGQYAIEHTVAAIEALYDQIRLQHEPGAAPQHADPQRN